MHLFRTRQITVLAGVLFGIGLSLALLAFWTWPGAWVGRQILATAEEGDEVELALAFEQLRKLDLAGLPALAEAIGHSDAKIRYAARESLDTQVTAWQSLPAEARTRRASELLNLLAAQAKRKNLRPPELKFSAELALKIAEWPLLSGQAPNTKVTYACEMILAEANKKDVFDQPEPVPAEIDDLDTVVSPKRVPVRFSLQDSDEVVVEDPAVQSVETDDAGSTVGAAPAENAATSEISLVPPKQFLSVDEPGPLPRPLLQETTVQASPIKPTTDLADLEDLEVIRRLTTADYEAAIAELQRRGYKERDLKIAEAVASADPKIREQVANQIPRIAGIDTRGWLVLLSQDESPRVRSAAIRWLSTSSDPVIQNHLERLAEKETDEGVRKILQR